MSNIVVALGRLAQPTNCSATIKSFRPSRFLLRQRAHVLTQGLLTHFPLLSKSQAQEVVIKHANSGQPYLWAPSSETPSLPDISVSHSQSWVSVLLSSYSFPCAIDIEDMSLTRPYEKIAHWGFSKKEAQYVEKKGPLGFYALWTAKEALAKSRGLGLPQALKTHWDIYLDRFTTQEPFEVSVNHQSYILNQQIFHNQLFHTIIQKNHGVESTPVPLLIDHTPDTNDLNPKRK